MSGFQNRPPLPKTALNERKLVLSAPVPDSKKLATLDVSVAINQPRIGVWTNVEGDPNKGRVTAKMDTLTFFAVLEALRIVISGERNADGKYRRFDIPCKRPGQGSSEPIPEAFITLAREESDGRIYIAVTGGNVTPVKFHFGPTQFHDSWKENREPINVSTLSELYANAWGRVMAELTPNVLNTHYSPPEPYDPNGNNGWKKGGGNGNWKPASGADTTPSVDFGNSNDEFPI